MFRKLKTWQSILYSLFILHIIDENVAGKLKKVTECGILVKCNKGCSKVEGNSHIAISWGGEGQLFRTSAEYLLIKTKKTHE